MNLKQELEHIISVIPMLSNDAAMDMVIDIVYKAHQDKTLQLFLAIQERDRAKMKKETSASYHAMQTAMHNFAGLSKHLLEDKTSRASKELAKEYLEGDNIAYTIDTIKIYFSNGTSEGCSASGKWLFDKFVKMLIANKGQYVEGGDSRKWAENFDHTTYIDLLLEKYDN